MNGLTPRLIGFLPKMKNVTCIAACLTGSHASIAAADTLPADIEDSVKLYVADMETYDSNIFRLPSYITDISARVGSHAAIQDFINTGYSGLDGQWSYAKQSATLHLRVDENRFANNSNLNNSAGNANLDWNWAFGSRLTGHVGGDYVRSLASFNETLYLGKDVVTSSDAFGTGRYQIGPHWALIGGVRNVDASHSADAARIDNFESQSGNIGIEFAMDSADTLTWEYRYANGHFPDGVIVFNNAPFDRDYLEDTINLKVNHRISDKTQVNASVGYDRRSYTREPIGEFSGYVWRVSMEWQATEKTQIVGASWRDLESYLASQSNYFVSTGASLSPTWVATEKLSVSLSVSLIRQNYIPSSPTVVTFGARNDRLSDEQATIAYMPRRNLLLTVTFQKAQRNSNDVIFGYIDRLATVSMTFSFN